MSTPARFIEGQNDSTELGRVAGYSVRVTPNNRVFVVLPCRRICWPTLAGDKDIHRFKSSNSVLGKVDFNTPNFKAPAEVVAFVFGVLSRQRAWRAREGAE